MQKERDAINIANIIQHQNSYCMLHSLSQPPPPGEARDTSVVGCLVDLGSRSISTVPGTEQNPQSLRNMYRVADLQRGSGHLPKPLVSMYGNSSLCNLFGATKVFLLAIYLCMIWIKKTLQHR